MNTSALKPFAQTMRRDLLRGVQQRVRYWGFDDNGEVLEAPEPIEGGYIFRGEVHADPTVVKQWRALKNAINRHSVKDVVEEAAYTWFNRLFAIRVLEKNGYVEDVLGYAPGTRQPALLHRARQGIMPFLKADEQEAVKKHLLESDDETVFRRLLIGYGHQHDLLNDVFGRLNDYTELLLPAGLLSRDGPVERLVTTEAITDDDYRQVELIGWLYQFYISEKKDAVYKSKKKFRPEDIPAATQIFTPRWIVRYMVENTLGRLWLDKYPDNPLRKKMDYLVESEDYEPAEPLFDDLAELKLFDPAAGSGHILVVGFDLLMGMYRERGYTDREAVEQILRENLYGLDIDRRAAQLARFALLMKAASYDRRVLDRDDLRPEVYALPEPRSFSTADLRAYLGDPGFDACGAQVKEAVDLIAKHGQNVGSALKLALSEDARATVAERVAYWDGRKEGEVDFGERELAGDLRDYLKPLLLLTKQYPAVATNPPYVSSRNMNGELKQYLNQNHPSTKNDLFATFMEILPDHTLNRGRFAFITPPSWMFLSSYEDIRTHYIDNYCFESLLHLSRGIFGADFGSVSTALQKAHQSGRTGTYFRLIERTFQEFDAEHLRDLFQRVLDDPDFRYDFSKYEKSESIPETSNLDGQQLLYPDIDQQDFEKIPGAPIAYWVPEAVIKAFEKNTRLGKFAQPKAGLQTGDNKKFLRHWPEVNRNWIGFGYRNRKDAQEEGKKWFPYNKGGGYRKWYGNMEFVVNWENDGEEIHEYNNVPMDYRGAPVRNKDKYFQEGITWSDVSSGDFACRYSPGGLIFDVKGSSAFPNIEEIFTAMGYLNSVFVTYALHVLNPTMSYQVGNIRSLPYNRPEADRRKKIDEITRSCISIARSDWDSRETSWDFTRHPLVQQDAATLEIAYASWQKQTTYDFFQLHTNEEELNRLFIDLYGLQDELSPRVALNDITILEDELDRTALKELDGQHDELNNDELRERLPFLPEVPIHQFLSYGIGVMLGRYRLGHDGLHIAHPNATPEEVAPYEVPTPLTAPERTATFAIDDDAILPLMGTDSPFSDDAVYRMREIVRLIWGEDTLTDNLNFINRALSIGTSRGYVNPKEKTMEDWLVNDFWDYHKSLYSVNYYGKKPIYWLFASPEGSFQALVYMHRMDKYTVQRIRQNYLQRYQQYLRREIEALEAKPEGSLTGPEAARLDNLRSRAADCRAYDAILKDIADQQIEIDLDDGVQSNYPKFGQAVAVL